MSEFTQGVCADGAAILKDGVMLTVEEIIELLRQGDRLMGAGEPVAWVEEYEDERFVHWRDKSPDLVAHIEMRQTKDHFVTLWPLHKGTAPAVDGAVLRDAAMFRWLRRKVGATGPAGSDYSKWQFTFPTNLTLKVSELNITDIESDFTNAIKAAMKGG